MIKRLISFKLERYLEISGAVLITGPKYCGKTFLAELKAQSSIFLHPYDQSIINALSYDSSPILSGLKPRLIDEWQDYPTIWDLVRHYVDHPIPGEPKKGLFILTGSTKPLNRSDIKHSGAGRILTLHMHTLTFSEILDLDENDSISIIDLIQNKYKPQNNNISIEEFNLMLMRGGWPDIIARNIQSFKDVVKGYIESIINLQDYSQYKFNIQNNVIKNILSSIARLSTSQLKFATIYNDINQKASLDTIKKYVSVLHDLDFIFDVPVWNNPNIRSKYKMRTIPKTYLCDTSILCSLLKINNHEALQYDLNTTGIIFENQVMKDLLVYANVLDAELFFYKDEKDNEIDAIMQFDDGSWIAIEIKLSLDQAMEAVKKIDKIIDTMKLDGKFKEPKLKLIITNTKNTFKINDNTYIIPHVLLRPC